jgi:malate synthase
MSIPAGLAVTGPMAPGFELVLTADALGLIAALHRKFDQRRQELLAARAERQRRWDAGALPDFLPETKVVRDGDWRVGAIPADLQDRRVEITGPTDRKMIINALNSGAKVFMADCEDATSPTWANVIGGQRNMMDRWQGKIDFTDPANGKTYTLGPKPAVLMVRPRGWHLMEAHIKVDGAEVAGGIVDFALYLTHNHKALKAAGTGPYFYLPKLESHLEARLWNDVFVAAQQALGIPAGTIKATVLIETLPAAFQMDEILFELKEHIVGLNCGRWDYIFSFIKSLNAKPDYVLPDRGQVVMGKAFLKAYSDLLIKTCHRRGAFAMGGMSAAIPNRKDAAANEKAFAAVAADKLREVSAGHDGTWVAHPDLVLIAERVFNEHMTGPNQLSVMRADVAVTAQDLLQIHEGNRTEDGLRLNIRVGVQYIEAWLRGFGAVPLYNLMEDAATAEISRTQVWQWIRHGATLADGRTVTAAMFEACLSGEMAKLREVLGPSVYDVGRFPEAIRLFHQLATGKELETFLTLSAYRLIV